MKYLFLFTFIFFSLSVFSQNEISSEDLERYEQYRRYDKQLYVDNFLKKRIPSLLYKYYYKNVGLGSYTDKMNQEYDTTNKIHKLYLYTKKAGEGFLYINKEVSAFLETLPESTEILYIQNQDTVVNYNQVLNLISLKEQDVQNVKYRKSSTTDQFIVTIITQ